VESTPEVTTDNHEDLQMNRVTVLAALALVPLLALADASGTWEATFDTQIGEQNYTYEFDVDGMTLTGMIKSANGESEIMDGKIEGDSISFVEHLNYQGMELVITYSGEMVSDDEIAFTRTVGEFATEELVAKRVE
jgi:hypothetical protein